MNKEIQRIFQELHIIPPFLGCHDGDHWFGNGPLIPSHSPVNGTLLEQVVSGNQNDYENIIQSATKAAKEWKQIPAPQRGELVRQYGNLLRKHKDALGKLVSWEMGKSLQEGWGEVQEMIDICDFAVGLSRQLHGFTMHSERPQHRMYEQYHPLGVVGVISAFNFPVAVWSWNATIALICGNSVVWKPSEKTPLCAIACQHLLLETLQKFNYPKGISTLIVGDASIGEYLSSDPRIALLSATGSTKMGKAVAQKVAARLGKSLLELGGNNAIIVTPNADLKMTVMGAVFGAVGTCGQRCTSTRRLIVHESIFDEVAQALKKAYQQLKIGNPLDTSNHVGPLIDERAVIQYLNTIEQATTQGAEWIVEGGKIQNAESDYYVKPAIAKICSNAPIVLTETFAPILYMIPYSGDIKNAIDIQNNVPQGLSSAIMTLNLREAEHFLSHNGSDCGIANVNIGTSGAEIGGAFGGEKETGGGRESGSDAWKIYMRRQTNTINFGTSLPLAQGITFDI
jgi:aldehyde dehydrogenase (NAD+)